MELVEVDVEDVQPLRTEVLRPHFEEGRLANFIGDKEPGTHHYALRDDGDVVAVVTYMRAEAPGDIGAPAVRLRGMAVAEDRRRQGLGARLLEGSLARLAVQESDVSVVWCNARMSAVDFYEEMGFQTHGEVFDVADIGPHVVMWRRMPTAVAG